MVCLRFGVVRYARFCCHVCEHSVLFSSESVLVLSLSICTESEQEIFEEVLHGNIDFTSDPWPKISESAKDLVKKMLVRDPRRRIKVHEVLCK